MGDAKITHSGRTQRWPLGFTLLLLTLPIKAEPIQYERDIQPLFDHYCVACHACFDAPCQLNLTRSSGVDRGASKALVYDGTRLKDAPLSRLDIDAASTEQWREQGFFSVTESHDGQPPLMLQMVSQKQNRPVSAGEPLPKSIQTGIGRPNTCPDNGEIGDFIKDNPHLGMPFGFPGLRDEEYRQLAEWLAQGAATTAMPATVAEADQPHVDQWERWLNGKDKKRQLVARWLYEHLAVARLYFEDNPSGSFYRLVRSRTPAGSPVEEIATRRPNDDPGTSFHYRFQAVTGTRVYKTHIPLQLNTALLKKVETTFLSNDWRVETLPDYSTEARANPFATFAAIPADARYQFMLDHAEYFVRTFIRGPVCRGQLATDVIRDHFWVMFQAPAADPFLYDAAYRQNVTPLLSLPEVEKGLTDVAGSWLEAEDERNDYLKRRQEVLRKHDPKGPSLSQIWNGDGNNSNALLTVFRHHDSATVLRGWMGQLPLTTWLMDYPLFERSYYNLVVNFDVFGSLNHQLQTRLYFDLIRNGSEQNLLRLLPPYSRQAELDRWYQGSGKLKLWLQYQKIDTDQPGVAGLPDKQAYPALLTTLLDRYAGINVAPDPINRCASDRCTTTEKLLGSLGKKTAKDMPAVDFLPDSALLRIRGESGQREVYTLIRNRRHSNVAFILGESLRYEKNKDYLSVVPGVATGYPNAIFDLDESSLADFTQRLRDPDLDSEKKWIRDVIEPWGLRRSDQRFWSVFHDINQWMREQNTTTAGLLDLNRYQGYPF